MTTEMVHQTAAKIPFEIRGALSSLDNETKQAVIIALLNEGELRFSELRDQLSDDEETLHNQTLTNTLESLQKGGLINKRIEGTAENQIKSYYEVSEYGERFIDCLLNSLGSVDDFRNEPYRESVENIRNMEGGSVVLDSPARNKRHNNSNESTPEAGAPRK